MTDMMMDPPPVDPNPMVEIPYLELQDLRQRAIPQEELDFFRAMVERLPALEQAAGERNSLQQALNAMEQERDRLKQLLLGVVPTLEEFSVDYPRATIARTAFAGETPEEIAEKMALWDAGRTQKASEWNSLVNYVRTQATV
jgi:hypothetical protein